MKEHLTNPDVISLVWAFLVKSKVYLATIFIAFVSGFVKYIQDRRTGVETSIKHFFMFSIVASFITLSALALMQKMGLEFDLLSMMIMFWVGIFTDYIYIALGKIVEMLGVLAIKVLEMVGGAVGQKAVKWIEGFSIVQKKEDEDNK